MGTHEDIIIDDILSKLSLFFECVSKFWNTSISEPYFKKMHLNIHAKNQNSQKLLIDCGRYAFYLYSSSLLASSSSSSQLAKDLRRLDSPTSSKLCHARVYCCCDGLFFMGIWSNQYSTLLMLWNPSTRESIILSGHPEEEYTYGMGYDSTSDDYKILGVDMNDEAPDQILSLKRGSWRNIEETSGRLSDTIISDREVCLPFVHGVLHWIGMSYPSRSVVSFNISDEKYGEIPLPAFEYCPAVVRMGVSVLGGRLCVYRDSIITFNLWVMKDYGIKEFWTKWFTLPNNIDHLCCYTDI